MIPPVFFYLGEGASAGPRKVHGGWFVGGGAGSGGGGLRAGAGRRVALKVEVRV